MDICKEFLKYGEYAAAGVYEEPDRSLFYRKSLALRRFYETCQPPFYRGEKLYPSGYSLSQYPFECCVDSMENMTRFSSVFKPNYMVGLSMDYDKMAEKNKELADIFKHDFDRYVTSVPYEHGVAGNMYTHSMPNYERILKEGLLSYIPRIEKIEDKDMREGLIHLVKGIETYIQRCAEYLEKAGADTELINAVKRVPLMPATNIYEAIQSWNFLLYLDNCDNLGCVASGLYPYYNGEDITDLLKNLFDNLDANSGWSMALNNEYNPLTLQCLEASKGKRRPMIELFVDENTPDEIWEKAFEVIRSGNGQPAFYNPKVLLGGLQKKFNISDEDIKKFCGGGCTESTIAGLSHVGSIDAGLNLPLILEDAIYNGLESCSSFDEFYDLFISKVRSVTDIVTDAVSKSQKERAELNPLPMRTLLVDDCIDNQLDFNAGGTRYRWSIINYGGLINTIDSMMVIRDMIFRDKKISAQQMIKCLKDNDEEFLLMARNHKSAFGRDESDVNDFSRKISTDIYSMLDNKVTYLKGGFLPASIQFLSQIPAGEAVGATPDGRTAHSPLCDSLAAIFSKDTQGPTALLNSVTSLNLERAIGVAVLNFNITPNYSNEVLKSLILGYMKRGGIQMQITCADKDTLIKAYKNPDDYKNLIVRVGGYSEYFHMLSDELKLMVINRTVQNDLI